MRPVAPSVPRPALPALAQALARAAVPVWGVFVQDWPATRQLLMYWLDTGVAIGVAIAVVLLRDMPRPEGRAELVNAVAGALLGGLFVSALVMPVLGLPLLFLQPPDAWWRMVAGDPGFARALAAHAAGALVAMSWVYADRTVVESEALAARRRFTFAFVRWLAVYLLLVSPLGSAGPFALGCVLLVWLLAGAWFDVMPAYAQALIDRLFPSPDPAGEPSARRRVSGRRRAR